MADAQAPLHVSRGHGPKSNTTVLKIEQFAISEFDALRRRHGSPSRMVDVGCAILVDWKKGRASSVVESVDYGFGRHIFAEACEALQSKAGLYPPEGMADALRARIWEDVRLCDDFDVSRLNLPQLSTAELRANSSNEVYDPEGVMAKFCSATHPADTEHKDLVQCMQKLMKYADHERRLARQLHTNVVVWAMFRTFEDGQLVLEFDAKALRPLGMQADINAFTHFVDVVQSVGLAICAEASENKFRYVSREERGKIRGPFKNPPGTFSTPLEHVRKLRSLLWGHGARERFPFWCLSAAPDVGDAYAAAALSWSDVRCERDLLTFRRRLLFDVPPEYQRQWHALSHMPPGDAARNVMCDVHMLHGLSVAMYRDKMVKRSMFRWGTVGVIVQDLLRASLERTCVCTTVEDLRAAHGHASRYDYIIFLPERQFRIYQVNVATRKGVVVTLFTSVKSAEQLAPDAALSSLMFGTDDEKGVLSDNVRTDNVLLADAKECHFTFIFYGLVCSLARHPELDVRQWVDDACRDDVREFIDASGDQIVDSLVMFLSPLYMQRSDL